MPRHLSFLSIAGLCLASCNAIFGIEAGVPIEAQPGQAGSAGQAEQAVSPNLGSGSTPSVPGAGGQQGGSSEAVAPLGEGAGQLPSPPPPGGSGGVEMTSPDAGRGNAPAPAPGLAIVDEALSFAGRSFNHPLGITGIVTTTTSAVGATIEPDCVRDGDCFAELAGDTLCIRGSVERVVDGNFIDAWGLNLQLSLSGNSWDRYAGRIEGISFELSGPTIPELRFHVTRPPTPTESFDNYCQVLQPVSGERVQALFDDLRVACWEPDAMTVLPPTAPLSSIAWQINAEATQAKPFDFCIGKLRPILASE